VPGLIAFTRIPLGGLAAEVANIYRVPVKVENDANAAALAEAQWGAGPGHPNVFYATIGTGKGRGLYWTAASITVGLVLQRRVGTSVSTIEVPGADAANEVASRYLRLVRRLPDARVKACKRT
jgi:hypothetical protein